MKKLITGVVLAVFSSGSFGSSDNSCNLTMSNSLVEFTENSCSVASIAAVKNDPESEAFDKIYKGKQAGYQPILIDKAASIDAKAEANNLQLWLTAAFSPDASGKMPLDDATLAQITMDLGLKKNEKDANIYVKDQINSNLNAWAMKQNGGPIFHEVLQTRFLNEVLNNPKYSTQLAAIQANVKTALSSSPNNPITDADVAQSLESVKVLTPKKANRELSPDKKDFWVNEYTQNNPFDDSDSQSYQVHSDAYEKHKEDLVNEFNQKNPNPSDADLRMHKKDIESIKLGPPRRVSFLPPEGVNITEFFNEIKDTNPSFFHCRVSYTGKSNGVAGKKPATPGNADDQNPDELEPNPENSKEVQKPKEPETRLVTAPPCNLNTTFGDDQASIPTGMKGEIDTCFKGIPDNAINVKIEVESCASTVRSGKYPNNLKLSEARSNSIKLNIPSEYQKLTTTNYNGKNRLPDGTATGTCGPWVTEVGEDRMDPANCANMGFDPANSCPPAKRMTPGNKWLCDYHSGKFEDGSNYRADPTVKNNLERYRYNKIKISYEVPIPVVEPVKPAVDPNASTASTGDNKKEEVVDPLTLPRAERLAYIESKPHISCLAPNFQNESHISAKDQFNRSMRDFTYFLGELKFSMPTGAGTGESFVSLNNLCSAYQ